MGALVPESRACLCPRSLAWAIGMLVCCLLAQGRLAPVASTLVLHSGGALSARSSGGLERLPVAAQGPVSAVLGRDDRWFSIRDLRGVNAPQGLELRFGDGNVVIGSGSARVSLGLASVGRPRDAVALSHTASPLVYGNRVSYSLGAVREWFVNGPLGLEQGFDVTRRPRGAGAIQLGIAVDGTEGVTLDGRRAASWKLPEGRVLRYSGLSATDAAGRHLDTSLRVRHGRLSILVDDRGARYPIHVDPLIQQGAKLVGTGESGAGWLGFTVAVSSDGNTALIGAPFDGTSGAAWVFTRSGSTWSQQGTKLIGDCTSSCAGPNGTGESSSGRFGLSVALSGDGNTALIGAPSDSNADGSAWVFTRSGSSWSQQGTKLRADCGSPGPCNGPDGTGEAGAGQLGSSVALSADGSTALLGAAADDSSAGAAWVFTRSAGSWSDQSGKLTGDCTVGCGGIGGTGETGAGELGFAVALTADGNTAVLGAPGDDSGAGAAWVFTRSGSAWSAQGTKLVGDCTSGCSGANGTGENGAADFGDFVALPAPLAGSNSATDSNTALIGGPLDNSNSGAVWVFTRSGSTWSQQGAKLVGDCTSSCSGASGVGEVGGGAFGASLALSTSGNTALIGGLFDNSQAGAAWVFTRSAGAWSELGSKLVANCTGACGTNGTGESGAGQFGSGVALSGDGNTALVGARLDNGDSGAGWVFVTQPPPTVTGVAPSAGTTAGGTSVVVTGTNFINVTGVSFGSAAVTGFTVNNLNQITATSPPGAGTVDVTVATAAGTSGASASDRFTYLVPTAVSVVCSPGLVVVGQSSACVTTVSSVSGVPGGVVRFGSGGAGSFAAGGSCALSGSGASASCSVLYTPSGVGSDTITASYGGDASHAGSSGSTVLVVGPAVGGGASVVVACSPGTVMAGQSTRCTVKVASLSGGGPSPTGIVQMVGGGGPALSGGGSCTLAPASASTAVCSTVFTVGAGASNTYMVIATYGGDGNYASGSGLTSFAAAAPAGVAAAVAVVRGVVSIKDSTGTFIPIKGSTVSVPVDSTIDATKGVIRVSTAADYRPVTDPRHHEQVGTFSEAIFEIKQLTKRQALARLRAKQRRRLFQIIPSTDLQLLSAPGALTKARCRPHSPNPGNGLVRAITGTAKGFYRTLAANSITTIHNATWIVEDRCDATITEVGKGTATVTPTHQPHPHPITIHADKASRSKA